MWKDVTRFALGDKKRSPSTFHAKSGRIDITITNGHIDHKGEWIMHCKPLLINEKVLGVSSLEDAKEAAISVVKALTEKLMKDAEGFVVKNDK